MLNRMKFAGIAAGLALVAAPGIGAAQVADRVRQQAEERRQAAEAARQAAGQQPAQQAPVPQHGGDEVQQRLQRLHALNQRSIEYGRLAAERATSEQLRSLGQQMSQFHQEMGASLAQLSKDRGVTLGAAEATGVPGQADMIAAFRGQQSGPELDQAVADQIVADRLALVDELKALRDSTPGKDSELKGWLDQVENEMENQRNLARQVRQEVRSQREARPAGR